MLQSWPLGNKECRLICFIIIIFSTFCHKSYETGANKVGTWTGELPLHASDPWTPPSFAIPPSLKKALHLCEVVQTGSVLIALEEGFGQDFDIYVRFSREALRSRH